MSSAHRGAPPGPIPAGRTAVVLGALLLLGAPPALRAAGDDPAPAPAPAAPAGDAPWKAFGERGPYPVGVRTVVLVDDSRKDAFTGGPRTLVTEVWYPAADSARGMPAARFSEFFGRYREEGAKAVHRSLEEIDRRFVSQAVRGAPLRKGGPWPLVLFSHGNGGFRHQNAFQTEHLASHGYLVAAPDHTGNSSLTPLPDRAVGYDRKGRWQSGSARPEDIRFLIDRITAGGPGVEWLSGAADGREIGVMGHSFGGSTAVRLAEEEPRVKAILAMTVAFVGHPTSKPTLVMLGAEDRTVGLPGNLASRGYFLGCTGPRYLLVLRRGGHFTFTEMAVLDPQFGDGIGRGKDRSGREIDFIPVDLAKRIIDSYTVAFFDRHLRGSEAAGRFLESNPWPGEVEWWAGDHRVPAESEAAPARDTAGGKEPAR